MSQAYWETTGAAKTFTHPLDPTWLTSAGRTARILDYGCGYGRLTGELVDLGFTDVTGVDISAALISRGRPDLTLRIIENPPHLPYAGGAFDVVLLFAVLTCVPEDDAQRRLIAELRRVLAPGGLLYVSDMLLQPDRDRYRPNGVFTTSDGAVCRHHDTAHLHGLLSGFDLLREQQIEVSTMNGNPAQAVQILARRQP